MFENGEVVNQIKAKIMVILKMSTSSTFFPKMCFECVDQGDGLCNLNLIDTTAVK